MKNTRKLLGFALIAAIALNALLMAGCQPEDPSVDKIEITRNPTKMTYKVGERFDPAGMEVTATYEDGTKKVVPNNDLSLTDTLFYTDGQKTVSIAYEGRATSITVTVTN